MSNILKLLTQAVPAHIQGCIPSGTFAHAWFLISLLGWSALAQVVDDAVPSKIQEPHLVQLERLSNFVPSLEASSYPLIAPPHRERLAVTFVGKLYLGSPRPQLLHVTFDTSSGQVVVPSWQCQSKACEVHRKFATRASKSCTRNLQDSNFLISTISLDTGEGNVTGELVLEDKLCFSARSGPCLDVGLLAATAMTDEPYLLEPADGSVGMSLPALANGPTFHFLSRMEAKYFETSFALFLGPSEGEIALGGFNPRRVASKEAFAWAPVLQPAEGFWQLRLRSLRLGNATMTCPEGCRGILDSSTSTIGVPHIMAPKLAAALGMDCKGRPELELVVEGYDASPIILRLDPEDYNREPGCWPAIVATQLPEEFNDVIVLGQPLLEKYYTIFDWGAHKIGFAPAANASEPAGLPVLATDEQLEVETQVLTAPEADHIERQIIAAELQRAELKQREDRFQAVSWWFFQGMVLQVLISTLVLLYRPWRGFRQLFPSSAELLAAKVPVDASDVAGLECSICLTADGEEALPWSRLCCGHAFHDSCIQKWLHIERRCPLCRQDVLLSGASR